MTNGEIIKAVTNYQNFEQVHNLTCGNDSTHRKLYAAERRGAVCLLCRDCDYEQLTIPQLVKEFVTPPLSLDGCPFNYCDANPKCEGKCRYS